ncbi:MAG: hypothetical protein RLY31_2127 [Bacteroidota bacterium]|jgi:hypothetical protein
MELLFLRYRFTLTGPAKAVDKHTQGRHHPCFQPVEPILMQAMNVARYNNILK